MASPESAHDYDEWMQSRSAGFERFVRAISTWYWDHWYRVRPYGLEHVPADGAFVLVPNHSSYADPFLQARPLTRPVRFMTKASLFEMPIMRSIMRGGGGFPIRRGKADQFAMELARRLLADGQVVVVYPEGTRFRDTAELGPAKSGAARLALEAGVPVVPVATWGIKRREVHGRRRFQRPRTTVVYGEPMDFSHLEPTQENVALVRTAIWDRVAELYEQARRIDAERASGRGRRRR